MGKQIPARNCYTNWKNTQSTKIHLYYDVGGVFHLLEMHLNEVEPAAQIKLKYSYIQIEEK